jgi:TRAP-type C4-dicarboxylate transport system substrate-binding protein
LACCFAELRARRTRRAPATAAVVAVAALAVAAGAGRADPVVLRMGAIAPEGTSWARELHAFARDVDAGTNSQVRVKWYLGGVAGDELAMLARARHGQLDGIAGPSFCERLAPSLTAIRVVGLFQTRDEVVDVLSRLTPQLDEEFRRAGFVNLMVAVFGADVLFSRRPVQSMADFRATRWWMWIHSPVYRATLPRLGARVVVSEVDEVAPKYQRGEIDGFIMPPSVALGYQLSTVAGYFSPIDTAMLPGCMVLANGAIDPLPVEQQRAIRAAAAKFRIRFNEANAELDRALLSGLFEKQGLKRAPVSPEFRYEFFHDARAAREQLDERLVPRSLLSRVLAILADYRAVHGGIGIP